MPVHEGVIWFLLATMAQLPPAVRSLFSRLSFILISPYIQVFILLDLSRMSSCVVFLSDLSITVVYWTRFRSNNSSLEPRMSLFLRAVEAIDMI